MEETTLNHVSRSFLPGRQGPAATSGKGGAPAHRRPRFALFPQTGRSVQAADSAPLEVAPSARGGKRPGGAG